MHREPVSVRLQPEEPQVLFDLLWEGWDREPRREPAEVYGFPFLELTEVHEFLFRVVRSVHLPLAGPCRDALWVRQAWWREADTDAPTVRFRSGVRICRPRTGNPALHLIPIHPWKYPLFRFDPIPALCSCQ